MNREELETLAQNCGMIQTNSNGIKLWTTSTNQLGRMLEGVVKEVKQSASETLLRAIKKTAEYERSECAKLADYAGNQELAKQIRSRSDD